MSYFPLFNCLKNKGFVQVANFSPNDWEKVHIGTKQIYSFFSDGKNWISHHEGEIHKDAFTCFNTTQFMERGTQEIDGVLIEELVLIEMRMDILASEIHDTLPKGGLASTEWPEWRANIGFKSEQSRVSYQGEINPTPPTATLLSFHPFIQFDDIRNYFVFINIEKSPLHRWSEIDIYLSESGEKIDTKRIRNNAANIIQLDNYRFTPTDLPVFYCKSMAGIPFGFGESISSGMLSLEHTHPPGSLTLHGNRMFAQRDIKKKWAKYLQVG